MSERDGQPRIWLKQLPDGAEQEIFSSGRMLFGLAWSPDGGTDSTRNKLAGFSPDYITESFGISPDGRQITLAAVQVSARLMLAENVPGLTRRP